MKTETFTDQDTQPDLRFPGAVTVEGAAYRVVCRDGGEKVFSLPRPARHADILREHEIHRLSFSVAEPGFLLSNGKFATRREAASVVVISGQLNSVRLPTVGLTTDELW